MTFYKVFTHDYKSPIQGGEPVWDGTVPFLLPEVAVDTSSVECGKGWNFVRDLHVGLRIGGLWPSGRPSVIVEVEARGEVFDRGDKSRAAQIEIVHVLSEEEVSEGIRELSKVFAPFEREMWEEQVKWRKALARPKVCEGEVVKGLQGALKVRGLNWELRVFTDARAARDVRDALIVYYASMNKWVETPKTQLTTGIRDAYLNGLTLAMPTGPNELGYVMEVGR